jgi:molecular chaperone GrpE
MRRRRHEHEPIHEHDFAGHAGDEQSPPDQDGNTATIEGAERPPDAAAAEGNGAELRARLEETERAAAEAHNRYVRTLADFDNFRKRTRGEQEDMKRWAHEEIVAQLLPILDNFERALDSSDGQQNPQAFAEGVRLIYRQLFDTLKKAGLEQIPTEGEPFDPTVHEAIMQVDPAEGQAPHEVVEELRKGYKLNGRLLRAALVKVTSG